MFAIYKKELLGNFGNWSAWIIIAAFSVITGLFLFFFENNSNIFDIGTASLQSYFSLAPWILMFVMPAISMRTIAEEYQTGTLVWLFSQPVSIKDIVLGKFLSVCTIGLLCLLPSAVYLYTIYVLGVPEGNIDLGATIGSYIGLMLLIASFSGVGILASALSQNQIMAYLLGLLMCFFLFYGIEQLASFRLLGKADYVLQRFGFYQHYIGFPRGLLDSRDLFYFLTVILLSLSFSVFSVTKKK